MPNPTSENVPDTLDIVIVAQWNPEPSGHIELRDFPEELRHVLANPDAKVIRPDNKTSGIVKQLMKYGVPKGHIWKITYRPKGQKHKEIIVLRLAQGPRWNKELNLRSNSEDPPGIVCQATLVYRKSPGIPTFKVTLEFDKRIVESYYQVNV